VNTRRVGKGSYHHRTGQVISFRFAAACLVTAAGAPAVAQSIKDERTLRKLDLAGREKVHEVRQGGNFPLNPSIGSKGSPFESERTANPASVGGNRSFA